ncbi:MAG TPA: hypothetical protein PKE40_12165 [Arachnia sp.]|nr:hypothetical protein [Arachnia sp.]HMT87100.1 hypothetical protein [Arachnia sp.]
MPDSLESRPRRGLPPEDDETFDLDEVDDTSAPARRAGPVADDDTDDPESASEVGDGHDDLPERNPFARPGDSTAPSGTGSIVPPPAMPPSFSWDDDPDDDSDDQAPLPRRSALSSMTPPEDEGSALSPWAAASDTAPRRSAMSAQSSLSPTRHDPADRSPAADPIAEPASSADDGDWWAHHRKSLLTWGAVVLAIALIVALSFYLAGRGDPGSSASPSMSPSETTPPIDDAALLGVEDAAAINASATWAVTATSTDPTDQRLRAACLSTDSDLINPTISMQRLLGTTEANKLAALHQIDVYASPEAAQEVLVGRFTSLAACSEVPARIVSSTTVSGLADVTHQLTVVYENEEIQFHTVLLSRTGSSLSILDVTQLDAPVDALNLATALRRPLGDVCSFNGTCPGSPRTESVVVPPTEPVGWLVPSDLPRLRPGIGRWTMTAPGELTSSGMGCEDLTLASEPGPTEREQSTLVLIQDDQTPEGFGLDEMRFTFVDDVAAATFAEKLGNNLSTCQDRVFGTTVMEHPPATSIGAEGVPVSARSFTVQRQTETEAVHYQLALTMSGDRVTYMLATVSPEYQFSEPQLADVAKRLGERATQG